MLCQYWDIKVKNKGNCLICHDGNGILFDMVTNRPQAATAYD
jgi:hypothetical protein|tara:strand:+ start:390 stop:515 length:126 start_codon:yes stop_codon:yes gene_type:complete